MALVELLRVRVVKAVLVALMVVGPGALMEEVEAASYPVRGAQFVLCGPVTQDHFHQHVQDHPNGIIHSNPQRTAVRASNFRQ